MPAKAMAKPARAGRQNETRKVQGARSSRAPSPVSSIHQRQTQAQRREKAEHAILEASLQIIAEKGIDALTLAEAGERAGYSRALPAHYFDSKDAVLERLCDFVVEKYLNRVQRRSVPDKPGLEGLLERIAHYFDDCRKDPKVMRAFHANLGMGPTRKPVAEALLKIVEASQASFVDYIRQGIARGEIRKDVVPEIEAVWILSGMRGIMAQWVLAPDRTPLTKVRDAFLHAVRLALQA